MSVQAVSSIVRQVLAVLVTVYGVLTSTVAALHLPVAVSAILTAFGPILLAIEHYLSDPSTGTTKAAPTVVVQPQQGGAPLPVPHVVP